jgi:SAM-dependent methyltransferase
VSDERAQAIEGAWAYERLHVDALFRQWAEPLLSAAGVSEGDRVLDVACGTGIVARAALSLVGDRGSVTGLDIGAGMLAVAESIEPAVTWTEGDAAQLPFDDADFDAVVSQFGLMFFPDRVRAIAEMLRCVEPGRRIAVAVWDSLERCEAYRVSVDLLQRRAGPAAADALRAPFVLGDVDRLRRLFDEAGASAVAIDTQHGTARFPSVRAMVEADLRGWLPVMGVVLDDDLIDLILSDAEEALSEFVTGDGAMAFDAPAHIVTAQT